MQTTQSRGLRWLPWLGGLIALFGMLILSVILRVQENQDKAWPITHGVVARLATDEGARNLFAKNPMLSKSYATPETFLMAIQAQRSAFGTLPAQKSQEFQEFQKDFHADSDPDGLRIYVKGSGGAWMMLELEKSDGSASGHAAIGEGITYLGFGDSEASIRDLRKDARDARNELRWKKFVEVEQALLTDEGVKNLLLNNPGLAKDEAGRKALQTQFQSWRPRLLATPMSETLASAPDHSVHFMRHSAPIVGTQEEFSWKLKDGGWFTAKWNNGRLETIELSAPTS